MRRKDSMKSCLIMMVATMLVVTGCGARSTTMHNVNTQTTEAVGEALTDETTEGATEAVTEATARHAVEKTTEKETEAAMTKATDGKTETTTEKVTEKETEKITEALTESIAEVTIEVITEAIIETVPESVQIQTQSAEGGIQYQINGECVEMYASQGTGIREVFARLISEEYYGDFTIHTQDKESANQAFYELSDMFNNPIDGFAQRPDEWFTYGIGYNLWTSGNIVYMKVNIKSSHEDTLKLIEYAKSVNETFDHSSTYAIIRDAHDFVVNNCEYDYNCVVGVTDSWSAYGCLFNHMSVCQGYARAFKLFMDINNIPCVYFPCTTEYGPHEYNIVFLDGQWYTIDCTWDDTSESKMFFLRGAEAYDDPVKEMEIVRRVSKVDLAMTDYPCPR